MSTTDPPGSPMTSIDDAPENWKIDYVANDWFRATRPDGGDASLDAEQPPRRAAPIDGNGARHNEGKSRIDLICPLFLEGLGNVLEYGARKYQPRNWERGNEWSVPIASLLRHLVAFQKGEDIDPESGLPHADHISFNAMQLKRLTETYPKGDDRSPALRSAGMGRKPRIVFDTEPE